MIRHCEHCGKPYNAGEKFFTRRSGPKWKVGKVERYIYRGQRFCSPACGGAATGGPKEEVPA